jgi:[ribosomal protein S18]-alanine N-acetyltransferase
LRLAFVAESKGQLAGLAVMSLVHGDETAELETILVDPKHRRRGVGYQLLSRSMREAVSAGARAMHLEVRASNAAAIAFYECSGFRRIGCRAAYYSAPSEDAIVLASQLTA